MSTRVQFPVSDPSLTYLDGLTDGMIQGLMIGKLEQIEGVYPVHHLPVFEDLAKQHGYEFTLCSEDEKFIHVKFKNPAVGESN